jgi:hypothetical protein
MKLTRKQLKLLIESYLYEQPTEEEMIDMEEPAEEEPAEEEAPEEEPAEETPVEEEDPAPSPGESLPSKFPSFDVIVDNEKYKIQFVKDESVSLLKVLINASPINNPQPQDFVTLAGIGLQGVKDQELRVHLSTVVKLDKTFQKFETPDDVAKQVKRKMDAERPGFSTKDIRKIIGKAQK